MFFLGWVQLHQPLGTHSCFLVGLNFYLFFSKGGENLFEHFAVHRRGESFGFASFYC